MSYLVHLLSVSNYVGGFNCSFVCSFLTRHTALRKVQANVARSLLYLCWQHFFIIILCYFFYTVVLNPRHDRSKRIVVEVCFLNKRELQLKVWNQFISYKKCVIFLLIGPVFLKENAIYPASTGGTLCKLCTRGWNPGSLQRVRYLKYMLPNASHHLICTSNIFLHVKPVGARFFFFFFLTCLHFKSIQFS